MTHLDFAQERIQMLASLEFEVKVSLLVLVKQWNRAAPSCGIYFFYSGSFEG